MSVLYATGFTGVAVVVLAAIAYALRISIDETASHPGLTASFLFLNLLGWRVGAPIYARDRRSPLGVTLMVLGDAIFPLNVYAPIFLYLPGFRGSIAASVSLIISLGVVYHLRNYLRVEKSRFHPTFYPYFFAVTGVALIQLTRVTLGTPMLAAHGLSLAYAAGYFALARGRALKPSRDFGLGAAVCVLATGVVAAWDVASLKSPAALGILFVVSSLLFIHGATQVSLGAMSRAGGGAAYLGLTLAFTGVLYLAGAPPVVYVVGTALWVAVLSALGILIKAVTTDPFKDSAHWLAATLGLGLAAATWPSWRSLVGLGGPPAIEILQNLPPLATAPALLIVAGSLVVLSHWRHGHPSMALSIPGFVAGMAFLNVTTFMGPLLAVAASSGMTSVIGSPIIGQVFTPLAVGVACLLLARRAQAFYPMAPIDVAGSAGLLLSGYNALGNRPLATAVLLIGALVLLWRSWTGSSLWSYLAFLTLISAATLTFGIGAVSLPLALLAVALVALTTRTVNDAARRNEVLVGLVWAFVAGVASISLEAWEGRALPTFAMAWVGLLLGLSTLAPRAPAAGTLEEPVGALRFVGYCVGHTAGALLAVFLVRSLGLAQGLEAAALAAWAWLHQLALRRAGGRGDAAITLATVYAVHAFALSSLVLAISLGGPAVWVACALVYAVLCFQIASDVPQPASPLSIAGYAVTFLAIALGMAGGVDTAMLALAGGAALFLWRSFRERSFLPHLVFLFLGLAGATLACFRYRSIGGLPLTLLALGISFAAHGQSKEEGMSARVRLSLVWALVAAGAALALEVGPGPTTSPTLLLLWLGFPAVVLWLKGRSGAGLSPDRPIGDSTDEWVLRGVIWLSQAAGATFVWHTLTLAPTQRVAALAGWVALHFAVFGALGVLSSTHSVAVAAREAVYGLSALILILAAWRFEDGLWSVAACAVVAGVYVVWFGLEKRAVLEHTAAIAICLSLLILGASNGVTWVDYYLICVGLYLCAVVARQGRLQTERPWAKGDFLESLPRIVAFENVLPALTVLLMVGYPAVALVRTSDDIHLGFMAVATVILLHVLVAARAHPVLVYAVCLSFLFGVTWVIVLGGGQPVLWLVLVLAGALIIAGLRRPDAWDQRFLNGGSR